jgi:hypothetical protein
LIKRKPGFSGKMFWPLEMPFKTGFTAVIEEAVKQEITIKMSHFYLQRR